MRKEEGGRPRLEVGPDDEFQKYGKRDVAQMVHPVVWGER